MATYDYVRYVFVSVLVFVALQIEESDKNRVEVNTLLIASWIYESSYEVIWMYYQGNRRRRQIKPWKEKINITVKMFETKCIWAFQPLTAAFFLVERGFDLIDY